MLVQYGIVMEAELMHEQRELTPTIPIVLGNAEYRDLRQNLERMDEILRTTGAEEELVEKRLKEWIQAQKEVPKTKFQAKFQAMCRKALRCNIARTYLNKSYREFCSRLADSLLLQWFCGIGRIDMIRVPGKSTADRFSDWYSEEEIAWITQKILGAAGEDSNPLELEETVDLDSVYLDTTCLKANIHFPVDWVLLRDATKSLMGPVECIRRQGLKHRMPEPQEFVSSMNKLSMEMTHSRRKAGSKKARKKTLRTMKKMVDRVAKHARTYRALLLEKWQQTEWSYRQVQQVIGRIDNVLEQLPEAKRQAHERIIGERQVKNQDKILSLYEREVNVIVRGKADAEVEFGNGLLLAENPQGLILHWELHKGPAPADSKQLIPTIEAIEESYDQKVNLVGGDRGFDTAKNREWLESRETFNGTTPKDPKQLSARMGQEPFVDVQRRRAQTEGRIEIFKSQFLGRPLRAKGYANRRLAVAWASLTHNLWVLARLPKEEKPEEEEQALAA